MAVPPPSTSFKLWVEFTTLQENYKTAERAAPKRGELVRKNLADGSEREPTPEIELAHKALTEFIQQHPEFERFAAEKK